MVELRDYQKTLLDRVEAALDADAKARVMMQLPTGGGKTEIAAQLLNDRLTDGRKAVWVTHRRELTEQTCDRLVRADVSARVDTTWKSDDPDAPAMPGGVVILMAQTLGRRTAKNNVWSRYGPNDLMVVDEAHHATAKSWERAIKQWPGHVVGMTATPWRLTKKEGFDHLFGKLICGPQVADLQRDEWLCEANVLMPPREQRILGGDPVGDRDYNESDIRQANSDRPEVMTARALRFWQEHAKDHPTIVYAVSVRHARNLEDLFREERIPVGSVLGANAQEQAERDQVIERFKGGILRVLINVVIVTEGFDLPDASCIVLARPTLSLALFMQMVGRGLRQKTDGADCLILDLADNTTEHGLPETDREWSLKPRGNQSSGEAPTVWCVECGGVSHAANHHCAHCESPFGEDCNRCGDWRGPKRWTLKNLCGDDHDLVCDLCHADAHVRAHLPIPEDIIVPRKDLLTEEKAPQRLFEDGRYWHLLSSETVSNGFKPRMLRTPEGEKLSSWPISALRKNYRIDSRTGARIVEIDSWKNLLFVVAEWLIRNDRLPVEPIPIELGPKRHLIHTVPEHADGTPFEDPQKLSNGLFLQSPSGSQAICQAVKKLNRMSPPSEQFYVQYEPYGSNNPLTRERIRCEHPQPELCDHPR